MSQKQILISIALIIGIFIGFSVGSNYGQNQSKEEVEKLNKAVDIFIPQVPDEISSIYGEIIEINNNEISVEIISVTDRIFPGDTPKKETRIVTVSDETKITQFDPFLVPVLQDPSDPEYGTFPEPKAITLNDISVGDNISITASENIKTKKRFTASSIQRQVLPQFGL